MALNATSLTAALVFSGSALAQQVAEAVQRGTSP